jgi:hypothetical protein
MEYLDGHGTFTLPTTGGEPMQTGTCRWCEAAITKSHGFWSLWRTTAEDGEYCGPSPNHSHAPAKGSQEET